MSESRVSKHALSLGGHFELEGTPYEVDRYLDLETLIARQLDGDRERVRLNIADILASISTSAAAQPDSAEIPANGTELLSDEDWAETEKRGSKLQLLLEAAQPTRALAKEVAEALGKHISTIYRWRLEFQKKGYSGIKPHHPTGGRGKPRIHETSNTIVEEVINEFYLNKQRLKPTKLMPIIEGRCTRARLKTPHINTVRNRIATISLRDKAKTRDGKKGKEKYAPRPDKFPGADFTNAVWQVDHTPLDVCIVDDVYRKNIGKCWITVVIDVFSRCVVGFYLSLDKPNATSVGMALVHAILPKEGWLAAHNLKVKWPIWGKPVTVHADNDKTFRCDMVSKAARIHNINLEWRAVATPHWGGHIERLLGTLNQEIHTLPGTTFSNPQQRGDYKPHEEAELNFSELEGYVATYLCGVYHQKPHTGIKHRPPLRKYEVGLFGEGADLGVGLPEPILDPERLRLDFLPDKEITVQKNGITWDVLTYYDPVIDRWINSVDPVNPKQKRKFLCRRDPRDVSVLWFLDPDRDVYLRIPQRNPEYPSINLWELRATRAYLREQGRSEVDEAEIFEAYEFLHQLRQGASQATQAARKAEQKKATYRAKAKSERAQVDHATDLVPDIRDQKRDSVLGAKLLDDDDVVALPVSR